MMKRKGDDWHPLQNKPTWNGQPATPMWILIAIVAAYLFLMASMFDDQPPPDPDGHYSDPAMFWEGWYI